MNQPGKSKPKHDDPKGSRRPRGLGGVILIMALLTALFVVVSRSASEQPASIYDFWHRLLNGQILQSEWSETSVVARFAREREEGKPASAVMEVVLHGLSAKDREIIQDLLPRSLDATRYGSGKDALARFQRDVSDGQVLVKRAFFISEFGAGSGDLRPAIPQSYVTAVLQTGQTESYVRVDPGTAEAGASLQQLRALLLDKGAQIEDRALSFDPRRYTVKETNTALIYLFGTIGPYLLVFLIIWFFILRQMRSPGGSGSVLSFGRSRAALYTKENRTGVTFDDVAGVDEAKEEVRELVEFLKSPQKFAKLGGSIPRGVLLVGSPGTGKTLLAKAIAGEADVPFFSISGSDFVEMFVGVGASRVRDLFKQARECSPCIVFLDEIDAVGRKRGSGMGGGHDEREQTLNAILVEMDGFDSDKGIILIGATNRPDVLDPALLRPGRFDRQVVIDMPDLKGREAILKVHARKVKMSGAVDLKTIARATPGFSGADLAAVINEAAILAAMRGKEAIEHADLDEARDRVKWGREKKSRAIEEQDRKVTAYHEAGHALVSSLIKDLDPLHKVTIVSRGMALGVTMSLPEKDAYHTRKSKLLAMIAMAYGGRIAEEIVFADVDAGAQNDIEKATQIAKVMVCELGMSEKVGPIKYTADQESPFLGREFQLASDVSQQTLALLDQEVRAIVDSQYQRAKAIVLEHRRELDLIAEGLLRHETLSGDEIAAIVRGDDLDEFRAARERAQKAAAAVPPAASAKPAADLGLSGAEGLAHS